MLQIHKSEVSMEEVLEKCEQILLSGEIVKKKEVLFA